MLAREHRAGGGKWGSAWLAQRSQGRCGEGKEGASSPAGSSGRDKKQPGKEKLTEDERLPGPPQGASENDQHRKTNISITGPTNKNNAIK